MALYFNDNPKPNNGNKHRNYGVLVTDTLKIGTYYEEIKCVWCNEVFLNELTDLDKTCSSKCKHSLLTWNFELNKLKNQQRVQRKLKTQELRDIKKQKAKRVSELKTKNKTYSLYKHYSNSLLNDKIRPCPEDHDLVEFKCTQCNYWFKPLTKYASYIRKYSNKTNKIVVMFCSTNCSSAYKQVLPKEVPVEYLILKHRNEIKQAEKKRMKYLKSETRKLKKLQPFRPKRINNKRPTEPNELKLYKSEHALKRIQNMRQTTPKKLKLDRLFYYSKVRAKEKKIEHTITYEWLQQQAQNDTCSATGIKFNYDTTKVRNPFGPSIDRINISKGYTPENCRLVIWAFNAGLGHYTEQDLYTVCKAYLEFNNIKYY